MAIVGSGIAGIATAYYLCQARKNASVLLIDCRQPMSYTSAQSGDNYRNWWPHPTMTAFVNDSIDELDRLARDTSNVFNMTHGGYVLATRRTDVDDLITAIQGEVDAELLSGQREVRKKFPALSAAINNVIHIRRGGDISGQQLGQYMLEQLRSAGGRRLQGEVTGIGPGYCLEVNTAEGVRVVNADVVVNAAGPFAARVARMLGIELPVKNIYQQKIAFEDHLGAIPRDLPFCVDLDPKHLNWSEEELDLLAEDRDLAWLAEKMPGGTHCRPEGGPQGTWVKLGWAYNKRVSEPRDDMANEAVIDAQFPEIVFRGAAAFIPALQAYVDAPPARFSHYGGYYTMTEENWPLIGPLDNTGAFIVGALSGFGSMAACAAGKLCAAHICGGVLPDYATDLSMARLDNVELMAELVAAPNKGLL